MKNLFSYTLFIIICLYALAEKVSAFQTSSTQNQQTLIAERKETILIIGVQHAPGQFWTEKFSPAHIRATLEAFRPQVIGVESNPEWFAKGQFYRSTYEAQHIAVPFALANKLPFYGIDWIGNLRENDYSWRQHIEEVKNAKKLLEGSAPFVTRYQYGLTSWNQTSSSSDAPEFSTLNSIETGEKNLKWLDDGKNTKGSPQEYMELRDNHIVDYITAVADKHLNSRIAIVIGMMHKSDLERKLRAKGFKVTGPQQVNQNSPLPIGEKIDQLLTTQDIAAILAEAWDSGAQSSVSQARSERLLKRLIELSSNDPQATAWSEYFSARQKMLAGNYPAARQLFENIAQSKNSASFPYRSYRWRHYLTIRQSALLELGRLADLQGQRTEGVSRYKQLLSSLKIPEYSEDIHSDYLFYATAYNAVRSLTETPYSKALENVKPESSSAASSNMAVNESSDEIQKAINLSRNGDWAGATTLIEVFLKKEGLPTSVRCQGYIIAASSYARSKNTVDAQRNLKNFDAECGSLPSSSWMFRERKQIKEFLK